MEVTPLQLLQDHAAIRDTILRFALSLDVKDWTLCRACFTEEVFTDYSALRGDPPATLTADEFVALRRQALEELVTHHVSTNHLITVTGDEATCLSSMVIYRRLPPAQGETTFDTHCLYEHTLVHTPEGWKIRKVKQTVLWNTGNPSIHAGVRPETER